MKILVSTDTSCLVNNTFFNKYDISVFPLNVIIDEKEYLDGVTINQETLNEEMRANKTIKTSTPPLGSIIEYFEGLFEKGYDHIIHFTISSKLSSMYKLFTNVSKEYFDNKITVIDSYSVSIIMLSQVMYAYDEIQKGTSIDAIVGNIELMKQKGAAICVPENLKALKNGGRISPAVAAVGNMVGLKPVIALVDGELTKTGMTRVAKKAMIDYIGEVINKNPASDFDYTVISFDANEKLIESVKNHLAELIGEENVIE